MEKKSKPVILGEITPIMLWGFKVTLNDRRTGDLADGYIVVTGNDSYDLEAAESEIRRKYGELGYDVAECEYDDTRVFNFNAIEIFKQSRHDRCASCKNYLSPDVGLGEGCRLIVNAKYIDDTPEIIVMESAFENGGYNCTEYDQRTAHREPAGDKPDVLEELQAALEELEEQGET